MESIEILAVVESVSNEKGIEEGIIFGAPNIIPSSIPFSLETDSTTAKISMLSIIYLPS